jgi:thymidylate kinase
MIISFSGIDCCGKSSQIQLLADYFREHGERPMYFWRKLPSKPRARTTYVWIRGGYTPLFSAIKRLGRPLWSRDVPSARSVDRRNAIMSKKFWRRLWLHIAIYDLLFESIVRMRIYNFLRTNVILDRYWWDSEIDFCLNFPSEEFRNWLSWRLLKSCAAVPDHSFLILVPLEESLHRSELKREPFPDAPEKRAARFGLYQKMSRERSFDLLDGTLPLSDVHAQVVRRVTNSISAPSHALTRLKAP